MGFYTSTYGKDSGKYTKAASALGKIAGELDGLAKAPAATVKSDWFSGAFAQKVVAGIEVIGLETQAIATLLREDASTLNSIASKINQELLFDAQLLMAQQKKTQGH